MRDCNRRLYPRHPKTSPVEEVRELEEPCWTSTRCATTARWRAERVRIKL